MALGDQNNNGNRNSDFRAEYYSNLRFKNYQDGNILSFSFKNGMLLVNMVKETDGFKFNTLMQFYITPTKAKILVEMMDRYESDINHEGGYGINAGIQKEIVSVLALTWVDGQKALVLGKVNNDGKYTERYVYKFSTQFHYGLQWTDVANMKCTKEYMDDIEYMMFRDIVEQFASVSGGAHAYTQIDMARWDHRAIMTKMNPIYDKLGIERGNRRGNNFFTGNGNGGSSGYESGVTRSQGSSEHKPYDQMMDDLPFDED